MNCDYYNLFKYYATKSITFKLDKLVINNNLIYWDCEWVNIDVYLYGLGTLGLGYW